MPDVEIHKIIETTHPQDSSRLYLCQVRVGKQFCVPFYSHEAQRRQAGEDFWLKSILENGVFMLHEHGPAPALAY